MSDTRIKDFTAFYHEQYQKKVGFYYNWKGGKEQKLMQKCLAYFDGIKGEKAFDEMKAAVLLYLDETDPFYKGHDLSHFLSKPEKWIKQEVKKPTPPLISEIVEEAPVVHTMETFKEKFANMVAQKDPLPFIRHFIKERGYNKKFLGEEKYNYARQFIYDFLGKEKTTQLVEEVKTSEICKAL